MCESDSRVSELERKIKDGSKCFDDYSLLAKIYDDREEFEKVLILVEKMFNMPLQNKEIAFTFTIKGMALSNMGNSREEEISCYEQSLGLLSNEKESSEILYYIGVNNFYMLPYSESGRRDEHGCQALEIFKKLSRKDADYQRYMVNYYLGILYARIHKFSEAIESFNQAIEMSENNSEKVTCLSEIANTYCDQGDYNKSEKIFERIFRMSDDNKYYSMLYFQMGVMFFESNSDGKAIDAFNNALRYIKFAPNLLNHKNYIAEIYWYLGTLVYRYNKDFDKAIKHLKKVLENVNRDYTYYHNTHITLGHCYLGKENYDKAEEHYDIVHSATSATEEEKDMAVKCLKDIEKRRKGTGIGFFSKIKKKKK